MAGPILIENYMNHQPVTVTLGTSIVAATQTILAEKISGVLVVDETGKLVGMLSELDCLRAIVERVLEGGASDAGIVDEFMTQDVETNQPNDQIINVASSMLDHKHRRRPIVDGAKLTGQVTCRQILKAIRDFATPVRHP